MGAVWLRARAHLPGAAPGQPASGLLARGVVLVGLPAAMVTLSTVTHTLAAAPARMVSHLRPAAALRSE